MEGTIERTSLPNKIHGCVTVLRYIEIPPCYDSNHKNALCCSSVASPKFFLGKYFEIREQQYLVLGHRVWKHKTTR